MGLSERIKHRLRRRRMRALERRSPSAREYWDGRARHLGARAVFNASHPESTLERVTEMQKAVLLPHLAGLLDGSERTILDFGCGPGRFTPVLARVAGARAIGVDISRRLLARAPQEAGVEYRWMPEGSVPLPDRTVDVVWIVLVLGGITQPELLDRTIMEIDRVLVPEGKLLLAESTTERGGDAYWTPRSIDEYIGMFAGYSMRQVGEYSDLDDRISILVGRKPKARRLGAQR